LDAGDRISRRRVPGKDGEWGAEFEYSEENGDVPVDEDEDEGGI
jgi:hypothetical protein